MVLKIVLIAANCTYLPEDGFEASGRLRNSQKGGREEKRRERKEERKTGVTCLGAVFAHYAFLTFLSRKEVADHDLFSSVFLYFCS